MTKLHDELLDLYRFEDPFHGGVTRLASWPEGLVLWHCGEIVWKSWENTRPAHPQADPHSEVEAFLAEAIAKSPEPLQELGRFLAERLDEDDWKTADRLLLAAATAHPQAAPVPTDHPAVAHLREHQQQLDPDGVSVGVSRQALDEVLALLSATTLNKGQEAASAAEKGSTAHQIEMAVVRETLRRAVVPPADECGKSCDCTAECERPAHPQAGEVVAVWGARSETGEYSEIVRYTQEGIEKHIRSWTLGEAAWKPVPLYAHPRPHAEDDAELREGIARVIAGAFESGGGAASGHDFEWDAAEALIIAQSVTGDILKLISAARRDALASRPEQESGSFSQEAKIPTEQTDNLSDHPLTDLKPGDLLTVVLPPVTGGGWVARNQPPLGAVVVSDGLALTGRILLRDYEPDFGWHPSRFVRTTAVAELLEEITTLLAAPDTALADTQPGISALRGNEPKDRHQPPASAGGK